MKLIECPKEFKKNDQSLEEKLKNINWESEEKIDTLAMVQIIKHLEKAEILIKKSKKIFYDLKIFSAQELIDIEFQTYPN